MPKYQVANSDSGGVSSNQTGVSSSIWKLSIPENQIISTAVGNIQPPRFLLYTEEAFSGNGSKTTFELNNDVSEHPRVTDDVVAYVDGSRTDAFSVDYANDEVTFDSAPSADTDNVEIFYLPTDGNMKVVVESNDQAGKTEELISEPVRGLHQVDQLNNPVDIKRAHMRKPNNLVVVLDASWQISTDDRAPNKIRIPYKQNVATEEQVEEFQNGLGDGV